MSSGLVGLVKDAFRIPNPVPTGLQPVGHPGPRSPVLATGNFGLTVRRVRRALAGHDAWLLVANSKGINVWCAAGGGHFTHHSLIAALRASGASERVEHRKLILPQLAATGIERRKITEATGWSTAWGPARLEDLPEFLDSGCHVRKPQRLARFPLWERLEMGSLWAAPLALVALLAIGFASAWSVGLVAAASTGLTVAALFAALPRLRVTGPAKWLTYLAAAALAFSLAFAALVLMRAAGTWNLVAVGIESVAAMLVLSIDLPGTTPVYPSSINLFRNRFEVELVADACTGTSECVQVCPRDVFRMNGKRRKVEIARPEDCVRCGACIVQCPRDALRFRFADGRIVEPATVRSTKMNMLGRRTVSIRGERRDELP